MRMPGTVPNYQVGVAYNHVLGQTLKFREIPVQRMGYTPSLKVLVIDKRNIGAVNG